MSGLGDLTMREVFDFEKHAQMKVGELGDPTKMGARAMTAMAWVLRRRTEPAFTFADAMDLSMKEVNAIISGSEESAPLEPPPLNGSAYSSLFSESAPT